MLARNAALDWGLAPLPENIPQELRAGLWCVWKAVPRKGNSAKMDKVPYQPASSSRKASTSRPQEWGTFDAAVAAYAAGGFNGIGRLVIENEELVFADLDNSLLNGAVSLNSQRIIRDLATYVELSPSGTGLRLVFAGALPGPDFNNAELGIEMYGGSSPRFLTITGRRQKSAPARINRPATLVVAALYKEYSTSNPPTDMLVPMPGILDEKSLPDWSLRGLPDRALEMLANGFDQDDRSGAMAGLAKALYERAMSDAEVFSTLMHNEHCFALASEHWNASRADRYLWQHHCVPARSCLSTLGFSEVEGAPALLRPVNGDNRLKKFLTRYVYVEKGDYVADLKKQPQYCVSRLHEFKNATANVRHEVPVPTQKDPDKTKLTAVHVSWLVHPSRASAEGLIYRPGEPRTLISDGLNWVNEFYMPEFSSTDDTDLLDIFFEHMEYLFPTKRERDWFIGWMAFGMQRPETRCKVTPLHVSIAHGTGRGWLVELIARLLGHWNCSKTKMSAFCSDSGGEFREYLDKSLFCAIEEVREGSKRYLVSDSIRDLLTDSPLEVNVKYGEKKTQPVFTNFFFMSNHPDALVLTSNDRRVNVFSGPDKARDRAYYTRLYHWFKTRGPEQLCSYLHRYDLSDFDWQYSMETEARTAMIENNQSETETLFYGLLQEPPAIAMTFRQIVDAMAGLSEEDAFGTNVDEPQLQKLLQHHARRWKPIKVAGKTVRPWVFSKNNELSNEDVREAVQI